MDKKDNWLIRVLQEVDLLVVYDKEVTEQEAIELFWLDRYEDIIDEKNQTTKDIIRVT